MTTRGNFSPNVANAIYLLSTDDAAWINGVVLRFDGGEHISGATP